MSRVADGPSVLRICLRWSPLVPLIFLVWAASRTVIGNGLVAAETRPGGPITAVVVEGFDWGSLLADCRLLVIRTKSGTASTVVVEGEANLLPQVYTAVSHGVLRVSLAGLLRPSREISVIATSVADAEHDDFGGREFRGMGCGSHSEFHFLNSPAVTTYRSGLDASMKEEPQQ